MKTKIASFLIISILAALAFGQAPEVVISSEVKTNSVVGIAKRIVVDMESSSGPSVTVLYATRNIVGTNIVSEVPWAPIAIEWSALTNRYPEVLQILSRMREDMAARMTNTP